MNIQFYKQVSRQQLGWSAVVLGFVIILWSVWWLALADQIRNGAHDWAAQQRQAGYRVYWQELDVSGYPFSLDVAVVGPAIEGRTGWRWSTERIQFHAQLWDWSEIEISNATRHRIFFSSGAKLHSFELNAKTLDGRINLDGGSLQSVNLYATALNLVEGARARGGLDSGQVRVEIGAVKDADYKTLVGTLEARLQGLEVSDLSTFPLGSDIARLSFLAEIFAGPPGGVSADDLAVWRDQGGVIEIRHLNLGYGPLEVETVGTLALDEDLQPIGALTARIEGYSEVIDALHNSGLISSGNALGAKLVLGGLAQDDPESGKSILNLPLSVYQRTLHAGPIALTVLPALEW